jgi:hypothetical protein
MLCKKNVCKDIIAENFPNLARNMNLKIQEPQQTPNRINTKRRRASLKQKDKMTNCM